MLSWRLKLRNILEEEVLILRYRYVYSFDDCGFLVVKCSS